MIGAASFLGATEYRDWPSEPIELVGAVPFLITRGYLLGGKPEPAGSYLRYCMASCDWSPVRFAVVTNTQMEEALASLIASPKWKRPLDGHEKDFLSVQIR
jgi:hypothetical protein